MICGNCKYFKPCMNIPAGLDNYGKCRHPHGVFRGETRYDCTSACVDGDIREQIPTTNIPEY